ncbi:MAG: methylated-DNA--[protein]-cysteine S-methyltransferase [Nitrospinota bacterium]
MNTYSGVDLPALLEGEGKQFFYSFFQCKICQLLLLSDKTGMRKICFIDPAYQKELKMRGIKLVRRNVLTEEKQIFKLPLKELEGFFSGGLRKFTMKLNIQGTGFQKKVWDQLIKVPYGETVSYSEIAKRIGNPGAARAVGNACNRNPLPLVIPCHRVVGKSGGLTGYAPGVEYKNKILQIEKKKV